MSNTDDPGPVSSRNIVEAALTNLQPDRFDWLPRRHFLNALRFFRGPSSCSHRHFSIIIAARFGYEGHHVFFCPTFIFYTKSNRYHCANQTVLLCQFVRIDDDVVCI
jgi:hypothetical protein